jgi:cytochrome P450
MLLFVFQAAAVAAAVAGAVFLAMLALRLRRIDACLSPIPQASGRLPVLGHATHLIKGRPWTIMAEWCRSAGNLVTFNVLDQRVVYVNHPKLIKRVLLTNQRNYHKDIATSYKHFMCILGKGLVTSEGEKWRKGRVLLSHALRIDILDEVPAIAIDAYQRLATKLSSGASVDLNEEFRHLTLQVICRAALSLSAEEADSIFPALYLPIVHECNRRVWEPWRQFMPLLAGSRERRTCLAALNKVLGTSIRQRWEQRKKEAAGERHQDILDLCMSQLETCDDAMVRQLIDDTKTMLLAGHETSAALLTWATLELMANPDVMAEVRAEGRAIFGAHIAAGTVPTMDDVRRLKWTPAVLRETLRKRSVVPLVMRIAVDDDVFAAADSGLGRDVTIPRGCTVAVGIEGVHHRSDIWPAPEKFIPQRFMDDQMDLVDPYSFIPFINGPRNCLGQHLSLAETQIVLCYLVTMFDLKPQMADMAKLGQPHEFIVPVVPKYGLDVTGTRAP